MGGDGEEPRKVAAGYIRLSQDGKSLPRQREEVEEAAERHGFELEKIYNEGQRESGYDEDRPEYQALKERAFAGEYDAILTPNLSRLYRDRIERMRLLLDLRDCGVGVGAYELGRMIDLDEDWELVQQAVLATADDLVKRKEIERSKKMTEQRMDRGYDHGRPPYGFQYDDDGQYWIPGEDFDLALEAIARRERGESWRAIAEATGISKSTVRGIYESRERYFEAEPEASGVQT